MCIRKKMTQRGFTLIEVILSLFFFMIIVSFVPLIIQFVPELRTVETVAEKEVRLFFNQLAMELREATTVTISDTTLFLSKPNGQTIAIEKYNNHLRRRVDRQGHDMFLQNISDVNYEYATNGIVVTITDHRGIEYRRRFTTIIDERSMISEE